MLILISALFFLVGCLSGAVVSLASRVHHLTNLVSDIVELITPEDDDPGDGEDVPVVSHITLVKAA